MKTLRNIFLTFAAVVFVTGLNAQTTDNAQNVEAVGITFNEAIQLEKAGKYQDAINTFTNVIEQGKTIGGTEVVTFMDQAAAAIPNIYMKMGKNMLETNYEAAIPIFKNAITAATTYDQKDTKREAEKAVSQCYLKKANELYKAKQYDEALKNLDEALTYDPGNKTSLWLKFNSWRGKSDVNNMIGTYNDMKEADPNDVNVPKAKTLISNQYLREGNANLKAKKYNDAIEDYKKSLEYEQDATAYAYIAASYNSMNQFDNALEAANQGLALNQEKPEALYFEQGRAYMGKNDKTKACEAFKKVTTGPYAAQAKQFQCN